ncbi:MAG: NADH-quinone oxidoreductase subunit L [Deltaproteobacteria bacterium]|nr:NADH-quinone oxidoreductase subunit L [Deltaproteobacteria bacterium]
MVELVWLIPLLPLIGSVANGVFGSRLSKGTVGVIGSAAVGLSFLIAVSIFWRIMTLPADARSIEIVAYNWLTSGGMSIDAAFLIDPLSTLMILIVTGVGFLIHVYSSGYMHHDKGLWRFFSYLNLFIFFMLMLVLGANYLIMFLGWEGVGLCSYLLIGFWYEKKSAGDAGKKAFVVNRIGDFGFILGLFLLFWTLSDLGAASLNYKDVFAAAHQIPPVTLTLITLLFFVGAVGKSAQIPLFVWLPDAMEGPTPVSALIHAATMVTAGVYMVARNNVLYSLAPYTGEVVAIIGIGTALFAATIGLVQNDIKKVLAYSTVSQLGYMFAAVGIGAYTAGVFHLMTHAFFKGLMFLGSGSVIHAMSGEQDMRKMGGLHGHMKITSITFIIGALAIAGIPPLAGFWSKDEILWEAFEKGHVGIWAVGLLTAGMTAFYMFRQVFMTFTGKCRADEHTKHHIHESPGSMTVPLIVLAVLAAIGGLVGIPFIFADGTALHQYFAPVFSHGAHAVVAAEAGHGLEILLMAVSVAVGVSGISIAALMYYAPARKYAPDFLAPEKMAETLAPAHRLLYNKYYIDELYDYLIVNPIKRLCRYCLDFDLGVIDGIVNGAGWLTRFTAWVSHKFDIYIVDGLVNSAATFVSFNSLVWRRMQTGYLQHYALIFVIGLILIVGGALLSR